MAKAILNELTELVEAGLLTPENAENIQNYYSNKGDSSQNRLFVAFGLLGAILVGLGIILIIAHNWDDLSRTVKTGFAFLPLLFGQAVCIYVLLKKYFSNAWREGSSAFLFLAVGASISLISQIYNIPGNISSFMFTWMLLCLPLAYIMNSGISSLMYLLGITYFIIQTGYFGVWYSAESLQSYKYWFLLALIIPYYYKRVTQYPSANFTVFNNWFIAISVLIALGTVGEHAKHFLWLAYMALFSVIYLMQYLPAYNIKRKAAEFYAIGSLGIVAVLLTLSFDTFWKNLYEKDSPLSEQLLSPEAFTSVVLLVIACLLLSINKMKNRHSFDAFELVFIPFTVIFFIGIFAPEAAVVATNLLVLALGIFQIREGARLDHLGVLNYGLLIITALVVCRFFDTDLSFVIRGILFLTVGIGFFATNYWMIKKRSTNEQ